jgi:hypothetical protein
MPEETRYPSSTTDGKPDAPATVELGVDGVNPVSPNNPPAKALDRQTRIRIEEGRPSVNAEGVEVTAAGIPVEDAPEPDGVWSETNPTGEKVDSPTPSDPTAAAQGLEGTGTETREDLADNTIGTPPADQKDVDDMSYQELRAELAKDSQDTSGNQAALRDRLRTHRAAQAK